MFSLEIVDSDAFLDMPVSAQNLYYHLGMRADDDGFVGNPRKISRMTGASEDDMRILLAKRFILAFESGVVVIKHWKVNNFIRVDRYHETKYLEEKSTLELKENGSYTERVKDGIPNVDQWDTEVRLGKVSIGKTSIGKEREEENASPSSRRRDISEITKEDISEIANDYSVPESFVLSKIDDIDNYCKGHGKKYKDYKATLRKWVKKDALERREKANGKIKYVGDAL
jgi:hypothetical protein